MCTFERPDLYYWAGWLWNFSGLNERPLPHVGYLLMSSLNVYFLSGLCTFERSDFVHLSGLTMNIWSTWLWTFERPDYVPLSGLCTFERPGPMYCSWLSAPDGWPRTPKPELYWCHCPTAGWLGNWCHMWRQVFHRHHLLLINKIWLCSNTYIYIRYEDHAFNFIYRIDLLSLEIVFPLPGFARNTRSWNYSPTQRLW